MTGAATVLVLTARLDPTADSVVTELGRRGTPVFRLDPADFPVAAQLTARFDGRWAGRLHTPHHELDLAEVGAAYFRRPGAVTVGPDLIDADRDWATAEARAGLGGLLAAIPHWLNHPDTAEHAERKPVQLQAAAGASLDTPRTLITNDPAAARSFVAELPRAVYKAFTPSVGGHDGRRFIYTTVVTAADVDDEAVRLTAHQFQEWIDKDHEVRLTVVDDRFFAARLTARSADARVDWRSDYASIDYAVTEVPDRVRTGVSRMLAGLRLRFASMDFAVRPDGSWVFLDLNPNGQWGWIEHETGLPICAAIATALQRRPTGSA